MKILSIIGGQRKGSNTEILMNQVLSGAKEKGAETKVFDLNKLNIHMCQACLHCRTHDGCAVRDDMQLIYDEINSADWVVICSPIFMQQVSAQVKSFMDRLYPFLNPDFSPKVKKNTMLVFTQGNPDTNVYKPYMDVASDALEFLGFMVQDIIVEGNGNVKGVIAENKEALDSAKKAGAKLVSR